MSIDGGTCSTPSVGSSEGDSIKVFVRIRPPMNEGDFAMCLEADCHRNAVIMQSKPEAKVFTFDHVADMSVTQETVFTTVGKKIIESCIGGYNGTIFAYGQTGSGKTFTMLGPSENCENFQHELRGCIPRSFENLFTLIKREVELHGDKVQFLTKCSFLEIYNEQIYDLLDEASTGLHLRENIKKGVFVDGLIETAVSNAAEAYDVLSTGWMNRTVASTSMNRESSRSHAVFTVSIESKVLKNGVWTMKTSQLNLVDLAGSERQKDTQTTGARLKEAGSINKSLSVLGNVIMSLVDIAHGKTRHVPYRDSKLSFLLRDSLGGNAKTCIIACVHPGAKSFGETMSTLLFARRAKMIKNKAIVNEDAQGSVLHLQAEIKRLKELIQQLQQSGPITSVATNVCVEDDHESSHYKKFFVQAMGIKEKIAQEKEELANRYALLQSKGDKMDKQLRSKEMVLKFRNNSLKIYENMKKEKRALHQDEKDCIIENLRDENAQLEEQLKNHPSLFTLKLENEKLRAEIVQLKCSQKSTGEIEVEKIAELNKLYSEMISEKTKGTPHSVSQDKEDKVAAATIERHKSQVENLERKVKDLQVELQNEKSEHEKEMIKLNSDLVSWKTRYEEVSAVQKSQCITGQIEREERDRLHIETLMNLTPKKHSLRNRTILAACEGKELSFSLEDSVVVEGDDILSEEKPPDMYETLEEELRKNREENSHLHLKLEEKDCLLVDKVSEISRLLSQSNQLKNILEKERTEWNLKKNEIDEKLKCQQKELSQLEDHNQRLCDTTADLNVIMDGMERQIKELKKERDNLIHEKHTALSQLSTKVMQLENEKIKLESDYTAVFQTYEKLKEEFEVTETTLTYMNSQVTETENKLSDKEIELKQLHYVYQDILLKLSKSHEKADELMEQLQKSCSESGDQQQEILHLMESKKVLEIQYENLCEELKTTEDTLLKTKGALKKETEDNLKLVKTENELREVYQTLCVKNAEIKQLYDEAMDEKRALHDQLRESMDREEELRNHVSEGEIEIKQLLKTLEDQTKELGDVEVQLQKKKAESDLVQDDLDSVLISLQAVTNEKCELQEKMEEHETMCESLQKTVLLISKKKENLEDCINHLKREKEELYNDVTDKEKEMIDIRNEFLKLQTNSDSQISSLLTTQQQLDEMQNKLFEAEHQLDLCKNQISEKQVTLDQLQQIVKEKCEAVELYRKKQELLQTQMKDLQQQFQNTIEDRDKKMEELLQLREKENAMDVLQSELTMAAERVKEYDNKNGELLNIIETLSARQIIEDSQKAKLEFQLTSSQQTMVEQREQLEEAEQECKRLRNVVQENSKEAETLRSELNQLLEQNSKLTKKNDELSEEILKIGSHANHQQKISMLHKRTTEVNQLTEEVTYLRKELAKCRSNHAESRTPSKSHSVKDKENSPMKEHNLNLENVMQTLNTSVT